MKRSFDEFWADDGRVRPHQQRLAEFVESLDRDRRDALGLTVRRRAVEQEVTFNILGDPAGTNRQWQLDWMPLVIDRDEFEQLAAGLRQRARLLDAVLQDLYGERTLLTRGLLPGGVVYGNPHYFRSLFGWSPHGGHRLHLYAADVGRDASGAFRVFSDRTAAPTGSGYALENRLVVGRLLAEPFQGYPVEKINRFFSTLDATVRDLAPASGRDPRVVVLTPGLQDQSSFEHAYLARYLGYLLVEGRDLTVREGVVYLKTLAGLERVDAVLRRVFDDWCDPLELRADSVLGVPGLLAAARAGTVALVNPLGAAVVESPAVKAFLPRLCRVMLGEPLLLDAVETRWCGDPGMLAEVEGALDDWVLKPAFLERRERPLRFGELPADQQAELRERFRQRPEQFVAERWPERSSAPVAGIGTSTGSVALRTFLCRAGDDFFAMPGGLARVDAEPDGVFIRSGEEKLSKDVWVPSRGSGPPPPLPAMPPQPPVLKRGGADLPSRLIDDFFWLGRYVERCDQGARLIRAGLERSTSEVGPDAELPLPSIVAALQSLEFAPSAVIDPSVPEPYLACLSEAGGINNLASLLDRLHQLALAVRPRVSRDTSEALRGLRPPAAVLHQAAAEPERGRDLVRGLIVALAAVRGLMGDAMVRGHAWDFFDIGRRVERGVSMSRVVLAFVPRGAGRVHLEALLDVADSLLTYRSRYLAVLRPAPVVDLLLLDETNPQAVIFQVNRLIESADRLPRQHQALLTPLQRQLVAMQARLFTTDVFEVCAGDGEALRELLEEMATGFWAVSDELSGSYFSHALDPTNVAAPRWIDNDLEAT